MSASVKRTSDTAPYANRAPGISPFKLDMPLTIRWQFKDSKTVDLYKGAAERIDGYTLEKVVHDPLDIVTP